MKTLHALAVALVLLSVYIWFRIYAAARESGVRIKPNGQFARRGSLAPEGLWSDANRGRPFEVLYPGPEKVEVE